MKPAPFRYYAPDTLEEVLALLSEHGDEAKVLAGGQSLGPLLNLRMSTPSLLLDLARVPELHGPPRRDDGGLRLAAMTTYRAAYDDPQARAVASLLVEAIPHVGHAAIRNAGTIGGSVAHADPAGEVPACLAALDVEVALRSPAGDRVVAARDFFTGTFSTVMDPAEVLTHVTVPLPPVGRGSAWLEVAPRHGDYATVGVGAVLDLEDGVVGDARISLSNVADTPVLADVDALLGQEPTDTLLGEVAAEVAGARRLQDDLVAAASYKRHLVRTLVSRALASARDRAVRGEGAA